MKRESTAIVAAYLDRTIATGNYENMNISEQRTNYHRQCQINKNKEEKMALIYISVNGKRVEREWRAENNL